MYGLGQRRELPSGWRSVGGAAKMIKAAEVQIRQGASMQQLDEFLQELCECYEVDKSLSEVRNSYFQRHVLTMFHLADGKLALLSALWFIYTQLNITFALCNAPCQQSVNVLRLALSAGHQPALG